MANLDTSNEDIIREERETLPSPSSEGSYYKYPTLSFSDSIRVFVLEPSCDMTAPIYGEIVEHRVSDDCEEQGYIALSYVWGDQYPTYTIYFDYHELDIGKNLDSALRYLRRRERPIRLWVDAICINQGDIQERNHQVQQMRNIYSSARETIIYLGEQTGTNTGISAWNYLERKATWAMNDAGDPDPDRPRILETSEKFRGDLSDVEIDVLERPWFQRLWVFQEVVVSKRLSIQCGNRKISWDDFCKTLLLTPRHHDRYGFSISRLDKVELVRDMFQAWCAYQQLHGMGHVLPAWHSQIQAQGHDTLDILNLLQRARPLQTSDPRDKIFGLLGICREIDIHDQDFTIDYSENCSGVYANFARSFMHTKKSYDLLSYIYSSSILKIGRFWVPSWVPNWDSRYWDNRSLGSTRTVLSTLDPESDIEKSERERLFTRSCNWIDSNKTMVACGSIIGKIESLSSTIMIKQTHEMAFRKIQDLVSSENDRHGAIIENWNRCFHKGFQIDYTAEYAVGALSRLSLLRRQEEKFDSSSKETPGFAQLLTKLWSSSVPHSKRNFERGTVEHHLLARSHKIVSWTNDNLVSDTLIVDDSSVVDGRRVAVYSPIGMPYVQTLALVPPHSRKSDYLIDLKGGRVPFTVRLDNINLVEDLDIDFGIRRCKLIGESLVNRVVVDDSTWRDRVFLIS